jgi:predicted phosphoribosyltransferase
MEPENVVELQEFHNRTRIFQDREHAGQVLANMFKTREEASAIVLPIPAGGVPPALVPTPKMRILN